MLAMRVWSAPLRAREAIAPEILLFSRASRRLMTKVVLLAAMARPFIASTTPSRPLLPSVGENSSRFSDTCLMRRPAKTSWSCRPDRASLLAVNLAKHWWHLSSTPAMGPKTGISLATPSKPGTKAFAISNAVLPADSTESTTAWPASKTPPTSPVEGKRDATVDTKSSCML